MPSMTTADHSPTQRLADLLLDRPVTDWAAEQRAAGLSWRQISLALRDLHNLDVTHETLRAWCLTAERVA